MDLQYIAHDLTTFGKIYMENLAIRILGYFIADKLTMKPGCNNYSYTKLSALTITVMTKCRLTLNHSDLSILVLNDN